MNAFWHFAKIMLRRRAAVAWALFFALISAGGLGAGILSLGPMLKSILKSDSLFTLAEKYNQEDHFIAVPEFVIAKLPADRLDGVMLVIGFIAVLTMSNSRKPSSFLCPNRPFPVMGPPGDAAGPLTDPDAAGCFNLL